MSTSLNRREFIKSASAVGLGVGLAGLAPATAARAQDQTNPGPNDKIRVAVIGTNGRGMAHISCYTALPGVEIAYICDVDDRAIAKGLRATERHQQAKAKGMKDFRKALEDKSLDAVSIAVPDHWHAPMAILALSAGKHVYLEKPCSHNPREGELLIEAVHKSGKVFQMGNQRRSFPNMQEAMAMLRDGIIGNPYFAKAWYDNNRKSIGHGKAAAVPEWLDYDLWQGPAPRRAFRDNLIHYNWHWFWNYGTGEALNNGTHEVDVCRWALGVDWPARVTSNGGRYQFKDDWETPDTQVISWDFPEGKTMSWEGRSCNGFPVEKLGRGAMVFGTSGSVLLDGNAYTFYDADKKVIKHKNGNEAADATDTVSASGIGLDKVHFANFIECVRTGHRTNSPVEEGHKSVTLLHLGNIAWRVGRELYCDSSNGHIKNDKDAMKLWSREYEKGWAPVV